MLAKKNIKKNHVYSLIKFACPIEFEKKSKMKNKVQEDFYDLKGNLIEHFKYEKGKIIKWEKYKYNVKGLLIEKKWYLCNGWDNSKFKEFTEKFNYDKSGYLITPNNKIIEFDDDKNKIETTFYLNGKIKSKSIFNSKGRLNEKIEYKNEQVVNQFNYDNYDNLITEKTFNALEQIETVTDYEYDNCFNLIRIYKSNKNGDISFTNFKYDNNNNLLEKVESPKKFYKITRNITDKIFELMQKEHSESYKHKYIYNENQLLIECELYLINNLIMSYEFEYKFYNEKDQK